MERKGLDVSRTEVSGLAKRRRLNQPFSRRPLAVGRRPPISAALIVCYFTAGARVLADPVTQAQQCIAARQALPQLDTAYQSALKRYALNADAKRDALAQLEDLKTQAANLPNQDLGLVGVAVHRVSNAVLSAIPMEGVLAKLGLTVVEEIGNELAKSPADDFGRYKGWVQAARATGISQAKDTAIATGNAAYTIYQYKTIDNTVKDIADHQAARFQAWRFSKIRDQLFGVANAVIELAKIPGEMTELSDQRSQTLSAFDDSTDRVQTAISHYDNESSDELAKAAGFYAQKQLLTDDLSRTCTPAVCSSLTDFYANQLQKEKSAADAIAAQATKLRDSPDEKVKADLDLMEKLKADWERARSEDGDTADKLRKKLDDLNAELARVMDELEHGMYCSKCMRTASEIEQQDHVGFQEHLGIVHGEAVPAPTQLRVQKWNEYAGKINSARQECNGVEAREQATYDQLSKQFQTINQDFSNAVADQDGQRSRLEAQEREMRQGMASTQENVANEVARCKAGLF